MFVFEFVINECQVYLVLLRKGDCFPTSSCLSTFGYFEHRLPVVVFILIYRLVNGYLLCFGDRPSQRIVLLHEILSQLD